MDHRRRFTRFRRLCLVVVLFCVTHHLREPVRVVFHASVSSSYGIMHLAFSDAEGGLHARLLPRNKVSVSQVHGPSPFNGRTGWGKEAGGGSTRGLSCGNNR